MGMKVMDLTENLYASCLLVLQYNYYKFGVNTI